MEPTWTLDGCYHSDDIYFTLGPYSYLSYAWGFRPLRSLPHAPSTGVLWDNHLIAVIALPVMPSANLCSVPPFHALEVLANVVAATTPPHPFVTVGQSCMGRSGLGIAGGGPPGRCSCYMGSVVSVPGFFFAGLYWFELICPARSTGLLRTFPGSVLSDVQRETTGGKFPGNSRFPGNGWEKFEPQEIPVLLRP